MGWNNNGFNIKKPSVHDAHEGLKKAEMIKTFSANPYV
mgnify:CR=1 FL=1|jgi:hypothetical protein